MTVPSPRVFASSAAALLLLAAATARAQPVSLAFEQSIYADAQDVALLRPEGVACAENGTVVVADTGNGRLVTFGWKDGRLSGGNAVKVPQLGYPVRLQLDGKGNLVALDGRSRRLVRLDAKGAFTGNVEPKGVPGAALLPVSFKLDGADALYVLDAATRRVVVLDASGNFTRQLELPADGTFTDLAVDAAGTIYAIDAVGVVLWAAERAGAAFKPLTASMKDKMNFPAYLAAGKGKLFAVDQHGNGVVVLGIDGSYQGRQLSIGWNDGLLYYPSQLCVTDGGLFFVADRGNNRVQIFSRVK